MRTVEELERIIGELLTECGGEAECTPWGDRKGCGAPIFWMVTNRKNPKTGKPANKAYNADGTPHWSTCPYSKDRQQRPAPPQQMRKDEYET